jgi:amino acid adenylation domain-containing protein
LHEIDLRGHPGDRETEAQRVLQEEARRPFDLTRDRMLRATLLRLEDDAAVLLLLTHQIASDSWSKAVLYRDLAALYEAAVEGREPRLPLLPVQYADYALWQRQRLRGETLEQALGYWKQQLAGAPPRLELPTDRPRPAVHKLHGAEQYLEIHATLLARLKDLGQREGVTLFMTLLAAFKVLLLRYTGQPDVVVGTPVAGRNRVEVERLVGLFATTLVLRTDLAGDPPFRELLGRVREVALGAYDHHEMPFEKLVEELQPERDLSRPPLFQVHFALENTPGSPPGFPGLDLSHLEVDNGTAKFDLSLTLFEEGGRLKGRLEYNTDLFEPATVGRLAGHFATLLAGVVADPEERLSRLPLLTGPERRELLTEWNDTAADYPSTLCIHEAFEAQAARAPEALAVADARERLTYGELNVRANRLAHYLRLRGVGPERLVAVLAERSVDMVVGLLAVLKAGGAYVPMDPAYPKDRLAFILEETRVSVLLTQHSLVPDRMACGTEVFYLDADADALAGESAENPVSGTTTGNLAYVIYTSGSTGRPKGVEIEHRGLFNLVTWHRRTYQVVPEDRATQLAGPAFDASVWEIWPYLAAGASVHIPDEETRLAPAKLVRWLGEQCITLSFLPTALAEAVLKEPWPADLALRALLTGGDKLQPGAWSHLPFLLLNHYGPTENTVVSTWTALPDDWGEAAPPIGRPIANARVYVLDAGLRPVPVGVPGELYVGGSSLARGYLRRPELTAERFIPDGFGPGGGRLYRTGDLVRYRADGNIEFLGRADHQVKVRGFRIELGEVEAALAQHPAVAQAVALAREDELGAKRLVAYVVPRAGEECPVAGLRQCLEQRLPPYMVPAAFVVLAELPLTPNGKVDRRALPAPDRSRQGPGQAFVTPRTPVEGMVAEVWAEVLKLPAVGVGDNFFHLGGESLLATQVASRLRQTFGVDLAVRGLFENPTLAELARYVVVGLVRQADAGEVGEVLDGFAAGREGTEDVAMTDLGRRIEGLSPTKRALLEQRLLKKQKGVPPARVITRRTTPGPSPLSFAQQRLWFLDQWEPGAPTYNAPLALRIRGALEVAALREALAAIVRRHEVLRTTYTAVDGNPLQVVTDNPAAELQVFDLRDWKGKDPEAAARLLLVRAARRPFDLAKDVMMRNALVRMGEDDYIFLFVVHHIAADGWSKGVLFRELAEFYEAFHVGRPPMLPELPIQYADFAAWQREWFRGPVLEEQVAYWKQQLADAPLVLHLPTDRPRPAVPTFRGAHHPLTLPHALAEGLKALCRQAGVTPFMALLAVFKTLLSRYTGADDILAGTPIANRNQVEAEHLIGFFVNTLVLRTRLGGRPTFRQLLGRVRETALGAYAHQDLPFEKLVEVLRPPRDPSRNPVFQVNFRVQSVQPTAPELAGLTVKPMRFDAEVSRFDLALELWPEAVGMGGYLEYSKDLFEPATIGRMAESFEKLLHLALQTPDAPVDELAARIPGRNDPAG